MSKSIFHTSFFSAFFIAHLTIQLSLLYFSLRFFCSSSLANFFASLHSSVAPLLLYINIVLLYFIFCLRLSAFVFFFIFLVAVINNPATVWSGNGWGSRKVENIFFFKIVARKEYAARNEILNLSLEITSNSVENVKSCWIINYFVFR